MPGRLVDRVGLCGRARLGIANAATSFQLNVGKPVTSFQNGDMLYYRALPPAGNGVELARATEHCSLDTSWGTSGLTQLTVPANWPEATPQLTLHDLRILPSGRVGMVGELWAQRNNPNAMRATFFGALNSAGLPDTTTSNPGFSSWAASPDVGYRSMPLEPNSAQGRWAIIGFNYNDATWALPNQEWMLNPNGSFNQSVWPGGSQMSEITLQYSASSLTLEAGSQLVFITKNNHSVDKLQRVDVLSGSPVTSFGVGSTVSIALTPLGWDLGSITGLAQRPNGSIIITMEATRNDPVTKASTKGLLIGELNSAGQPTTTFGPSGWHEIVIPDAVDSMQKWIYRPVLQSDGKLIAPVQYHLYEQSAGQYTRTKIYRFLPTGALDSAYGSNGIADINHELAVTGWRVETASNGFTNPVMHANDQLTLMEGSNFIRLFP